MTQYISSDTLIHFGVKGQKHGDRRYQNEDGSLTPLGREHYGVGQGRKSFYRYGDGSLTRAGISKYRRLKKKYDKAEKKAINAEKNVNLKDYRQYAPVSPKNTRTEYNQKAHRFDMKLKYDEEKEKMVGPKYWGNSVKSVQSGFNKKSGYSYNARYIKAVGKRVETIEKRDALAAKIGKITGENVYESEARYRKGAVIDSHHARQLVDSASKQYIQHYGRTTQSKIKSYKMGIKDLEKVFPNSTRTLNEQLVEYVSELEQKNGGKLYKHL